MNVHKVETTSRILVKPAEGARILSISRSKMYELIARGVIPSVRLDGDRLIRIPLAALEQLAQRADNTAPQQQDRDKAVKP